MPFTAVTYDIKPGFEDEIAEVFGSFRRVGSSNISTTDGEPTSRILATAVFIQGATLVRVIEYEGDLDVILRFMASQPGVREVEQRLVPYLNSPRDTGTPDGFIATFHRNTMRCLSQLSVGR
ncbi:MAG TPA: SchA/CurD-like domain-containing protein [Micromonosporaceae bacterium]